MMPPKRLEGKCKEFSQTKPKLMSSSNKMHKAAREHSSRRGKDTLQLCPRNSPQDSILLCAHSDKSCSCCCCCCWRIMMRALPLSKTSSATGSKKSGQHCSPSPLSLSRYARSQKSLASGGTSSSTGTKHCSLMAQNYYLWQRSRDKVKGQLSMSDRRERPETTKKALRQASGLQSCTKVGSYTRSVFSYMSNDVYGSRLT